MLAINLDRRAGKSWRLVGSDTEISLIPSVWRTTGCRSHFVVWRNVVYLLTGWEEDAGDVPDREFANWVEMFLRLKQDRAEP